MVVCGDGDPLNDQGCTFSSLVISISAVHLVSWDPETSFKRDTPVCWIRKYPDLFLFVAIYPSSISGNCWRSADIGLPYNLKNIFGDDLRWFRLLAGVGYVTGMGCDMQGDAVLRCGSRAKLMKDGIPDIRLVTATPPVGGAARDD